MGKRPDHLSRIAGAVNLRRFRRKRVVVVGVGWVGSEIAQWLAKSGVGHLTLIDGKDFNEHNIVRHALTGAYFGQNKATALADQLSAAIPSLRVMGIPRNVDDSLSDREVNELIMAADVVVVATDNRETQRRLARRTLELEIEAVFPGLYEGGGGEVFVQLKKDRACFMCWDGFRPAHSQLRDMAGLGIDGLFVVQLAVELCLGLLDQNLIYERRFAGDKVPSPVQLFRLRIEHGFALVEAHVDKRTHCPSCGIVPVPPAQEVSEPPQSEAPSTVERGPRSTVGRIGQVGLLLVVAFVGLIAVRGLSSQGAHRVPVVVSNVL